MLREVVLTAIFTVAACGEADVDDTNATEPSAGADDGNSPADGGDRDACAGRSGAPVSEARTLAGSGGDRTYLLHVPESYSTATPSLLVLNFHGFTSTGEIQAATTGMRELADERGFIAVHPDGVNNAWNGGTCCNGETDDVQFVRDLVDAISNEYCVDDKRIYATGISNGGLFANRLGCEAEDLVAAIAPVAAGIGVPCEPSRPVPVLAFAGSADGLVPFGIQELQVTHWREQNGCSDASSIVYDRGDATCEQWSECEEDAAVRLCVIDQGGHTWPGGVPIPLGKTSTDIDATAEMVTFFEAHPMP